MVRNSASNGRGRTLKWLERLSRRVGSNIGLACATLAAVKVDVNLLLMWVPRSLWHYFADFGVQRIVQIHSAYVATPFMTSSILRPLGPVDRCESLYSYPSSESE